MSVHLRAISRPLSAGDFFGGIWLTCTIGLGLAVELLVALWLGWTLLGPIGVLLLRAFGAG